MSWSTVANSPLPTFDLGLAPYGPVQELQHRLRLAVAERRIPGAILLLEHPLVITLGKRGRLQSDLRDPGAIEALGVEVVWSERGGQATLHAPGQLVIYPVVPIPRRNLRAYVHGLEETTLLLLSDLGIAASRRAGHPGLYVNQAKIASLGLRCKHWVASHGVSVNVNVDLDLFALIVSCGEPDLRQTSVRAITGRDWCLKQIKGLWLEKAALVFGWEPAPLRALPYHEIEPALGLDYPATDPQRLADDEKVPTAGFEPAAPGSGGQCSIP